METVKFYILDYIDKSKTEAGDYVKYSFHIPAFLSEMDLLNNIKNGGEFFFPSFDKYNLRIDRKIVVLNCNLSTLALCGDKEGLIDHVVAKFETLGQLEEYIKERF